MSESTGVRVGPDRAPRHMIDLRSDAVTRPTPEMWDAMRSAKLGWAHVAEDENVRWLEEKISSMAGMEDAVLVPSGTVGNLIALMSHTQRGEQVILDRDSHIMWCEEWGIAYVCGALPRSLPANAGQMDLDEVEFTLNQTQLGHRPRTAVICVENTHNLHGGAILPADYISSICSLAHDDNARVHVDGARIFNARAETGLGLADSLPGADSVVVNFNKGLSAPGGAAVLGTRAFTAECRINLRRIGGHVIHQAGILAAAALVALETGLEQLRTDNANAREIARLAADVSPLRSLFPVATNIVYIQVDPQLGCAAHFSATLDRFGVRGFVSSHDTLRFVTHRHVTSNELPEIEIALRTAVERHQGAQEDRDRSLAR